MLNYDARNRELKINFSGWWPASYCGGSGSIPSLSISVLWWTVWYLDVFFSAYFCFPLSVSFNQCSILLFIDSVDEEE